MKVRSEFSKHAAQYDNYSIIQNKVVQKLLSHVSIKPKRILDLGCGSGALCRAINWEYDHFVGVDFAPGMLRLHPRSSKIECVHGDFNDPAFFKKVLTHIYTYDFIFSASALQWADNLESIFSQIRALDVPIALALFTSDTFKTINETASIDSILRSAEEIYALQEKYFDAEFEIVRYRLEFESTREMFRYIKKSGVSGSRKILNYKQSKKLLYEYPLSYLEFEVAFVYTPDK